MVLSPAADAEIDQMSCFPFGAAERSAQKSVTLNLLLKQNPLSCSQVHFADRNV